jgi:dTDP-4-amino-4,6-dideoxygalactose transaminase
MTSTDTDAAAPVPLVDLGWQHRQVAEEVRAGFDAVLSSTAFVLGPHVAAFEAEFAQYCGVGHCVGVANGTDAIELALRASGVGEGDEVILPANTFFATAEAVVRAGASVVLVDCDEDFLIDVTKVKEALTERTRAVIAVHLYGQMAPVGQLRAILPDSVLLFEDGAQSQGAQSQGARSGSVGLAAATSFYPGKNLGAYGDAGAVMTDSAEVAEALRRLRNHGGVARYEHETVGMNSRLDGLQAVVLSAKLRRLDAWNAARREAARRYGELLGDVAGCVLPRVVPGNEHVWHLYVVRVPERDRVLAEVQAAGIGAGLHYPVPVHLLPATQRLELGVPGDFPVAERLAGEILSLPLFPGITDGQQVRVAEALRDALGATPPAAVAP